MFRLVALAALAAGLALLFRFDPAHSLVTFSCGAVTGLPCLFCGMTRAAHELLRGHWSAALYFNWLVFPASALSIAVALRFVLELGWRRQVRWRFGSGRWTASTKLLGTTALLFALWVLQVFLAVSQHKAELLNPDGFLYSFVVR